MWKQAGNTDRFNMTPLPTQCAVCLLPNYPILGL